MADRLTTASINLQHYTHNISKILEMLPASAQLMAVVKANAYGHGLEKIAETAIKSGATSLAVVSLGELKRVREAQIVAPVLIINYLDPESVAEAVLLDASITVMDEEIISIIASAANEQSKQVKVHIKVDTGMHRAGCDPTQVLSIAKKVQNFPQLHLEGLFTHFAESEALDQGFTHQQLQVFNQSVALLSQEGINPPLLHCANGAAIVASSETHFSMVRPGLISYGLNPYPIDHPRYDFVKEHFKPVLSLKSQFVFIRTISSGQTVGYNRRWRAERQSTLAVLPVGYGDGYRRTPQNAMKVLINGQYAPIVGSVAMDQTVVDITDVDGAVSVGDEVVLLGKQGDLSITADDLAEAYGTINYEVVTALMDRIPRHYTV